MAALPSQNQLYANYIRTCCALGIRKPNKHITDLLAEDTYSRRTRLEYEAKQLRVSDAELEASENVPEVSVPALSSLEEIPDLHLCGHLGSKGIIAMLTSIVKECPLIQRVDLATLTNFFDADPYKQSPCGNDVIRTLCDVAASHPSLHTIRLGAHRLGTVAGQELLRAIQQNPQLKCVEYAEATMHPAVHESIQRALSANQRGANRTGRVTEMPTQLSKEILKVTLVDRKTSDQRQLLSNLLSDLIASLPFSSSHDSVANDVPVALQRSDDAPPPLSAETVSRLVDESTPITLHEAVQGVNSLRGDGRHLFLVARGSLSVTFGGANLPLRLARGDFFGEPSHSPLYPAGSMEVAERGLAFRIPLDLIEPLTSHWSRRAEEFMPLLRKVPLLQPLNAWTLVRLCMCSVTRRFVKGAVVEPLFVHQDEFSGIFIVAHGSVRLTIPEDRPITPACGGAERPEGTFVPIGGWSATPLDLFGFEAAFSTQRLSPVAATPNTEGGPVVCLKVALSVSDRHVVAPLRESLLVEARSKIKEAKSVVIAA